MLFLFEFSDCLCCRNTQYIKMLIQHIHFLSPLCICLVCISAGRKVRKWALRVCSNTIRQRHRWQNNTPTRSGTATFPHFVPRQTGTNMGGEEKCINGQIAFTKLLHTASGLIVKDLCSTSQRLVRKTKSDINLADFNVRLRWNYLFLSFIWNVWTVINCC